MLPVKPETRSKLEKIAAEVGLLQVTLRFQICKQKPLPLINRYLTIDLIVVRCFLCLRADSGKKRAATPFSTAAHASPPNTAAGRRSSGFRQRPCSRGLTHLGEHPSWEDRGKKTFLQKFFSPSGPLGSDLWGMKCTSLIRSFRRTARPSRTKQSVHRVANISQPSLTR